MSRANRGELYAGLISGTSVDGVDAALVEFGDRQANVVACHAEPYATELRDALLDAIANPDSVGLDVLGGMDAAVGQAFRDAALALFDKAGVTNNTIRAIGSHGQTVRHRPGATPPFTLQIGDPNLIAAGTSVTVVADFRRRDLASGGEGAPLAPAFHHWLFRQSADAVLNLGGIANVTLLAEAPEDVIGFDTGPANTLLDAHVRRERGLPYDENGEWAASGTIDDALLEALLADPYFAAAAPKSTGFEHFNLAWLDAKIGERRIPTADVQATLVALSARTAADAIRRAVNGNIRVVACGGGVHNPELMRALRQALGSASLETTDALGLAPDWVEAAAFAWLAKQALAGRPGNLPSVTGARDYVVLGGIYRS